MGKIGHVVICEKVLRDEKGENNFLVNPITAAGTDSLPKSLHCVVSVGIYDIEDFSYSLSVKVINPDGIVTHESSVQSIGPLGAIPSKSNVINIKFDKIELTKFGVYTFKVVFDDHKNPVEKVLSLPVYEAKEGEE